MKVMLIGLLIVTAVGSSSFAQQGSVDVGYENEAGGERWLSKEPPGDGIAGISCPPAEALDDTVSCGSIIVFNHTSEIVTVDYKTNHEGFVVGMSDSLVLGSATGEPLPQPCSRQRDNQLGPGKRCFEGISFSPRTGEEQHATIRVIIKSPARYKTTFLKLTGTSHYPPDLQAAEEVRQRHAAQLKKIPNVVSVELDNQDGIRINVTVKDEDDIPEVRKQVPPKIEGYDSEVTQYIGRAYAL